MKLFLLALAVVGATAATLPPAPPTPVTCATIAAALGTASPGDTLALTAATPCPAITIANRHFTPAVTIDASAANLTSVSLNSVTGITWRGGVFDGGDTLSTGFGIGGSDHVGIENATLRRYLRNAIGVGSSSDLRIVGNTISRSGSDGIDIALSRRILIDANTCMDFNPTAGAHPDCIQLWSRPNVPPVADVTISRNVALGIMQGINGFNHVRDGVDDGGFDRISVTDNTVAVGMPDGIYFTDCRACTFKGNHFYTLHGAPHWTNFVVNGKSTGSFLAADQTFQDLR